MTNVVLTVNGERREADVEPRQLLVYLLRDQLRLKGTNVGCDTSSCGACTVLLDGRPVSSCLLLAPLARDREITTIEGLAAADGSLDPVQQAFVDHNAFQCSYCTPGFVLSAKALLAENSSPTESDVEEYLSGNLCRCGCYREIVQAVVASIARPAEPAGVR